MASNDITSPRVAKILGLPTADDLARQDRINENLDAAIAIIDCVKVASAGRGAAHGFEVADESMPTALSYARRLLDEVRDLRS